MIEKYVFIIICYIQIMIIDKLIIHFPQIIIFLLKYLSDYYIRKKKKNSI